MIARPGCSLLLLLALLGPQQILAQEILPEGSVLSEGVPVPPIAATTERANGEVYVQQQVKDWEIRCVYLIERADTCQMYQLLVDEAATPTAEVTLFPVLDDKFEAGARVVTPLETALLAGVTFQIDDGLPTQYPFQVCNPTGCIAQIGLTTEQVADMKAGAEARMTIVPFRAQQTQVNLSLSLVGFTSAFDTLKELDAEPDANQ